MSDESINGENATDEIFTFISWISGIEANTWLQLRGASELFALRPIEIVPPVIINNTDAFFIKITVFERCRDYVFREAKLQKNVELQTTCLFIWPVYPIIAARAYM